MAKYAVLSDIHSNLEALTTVLDKCRELEVDHYISLGDIVGYNADPAACYDLVRQLNFVSMVRGNHDEYTGSDDEVMSGFNQSARQAILWTRRQLTAEQRKWLVNTPYRTSMMAINATLVHATLDSPEHWGYIFDEHHARDNFSYQHTQICFCGHSHVPVAFCKKPVAKFNERTIEEILEWNQRIEDGSILTPDFAAADESTVEIKIGYKYLFNVGSIGQPRNRDPRTSFAVYDTNERQITRYRLPYDIELTQSKVLAAGLPERLAVRLATGS